MPLVVHLIPNAHLDPVWLWDRAEGLNQGIATVRTVLDLMDEHPELTFVRGESLIYEHIERFDPQTFERIRQRHYERRWEIVGGTYVQSDTNLPGTESTVRQILRGQTYFQERFGERARVAWSTDSFGHSAGIPTVFASAGYEAYACCRMGNAFETAPTVFWWEGPDGSHLLVLHPLTGWYGAERREMPERLDGLKSIAAERGLAHVPCPFGLGDHGGGPSRRHLADIQSWAGKNPEVELRYSGWNGYLDAVKQEVGAGRLDCPVFQGELNFTLRGCYASMMPFKALFREAERTLVASEAASELVAKLDPTTEGKIGGAWDALLFNAFHDILPGTSIERAFDQQFQHLGGAVFQAREAMEHALTRLAMQVDTSVPLAGHDDHPRAVPMLVWNPLPRPVRVPIELETCIDDRPIWSYLNRPGELPIELRGPDGALIPFQKLPTENASITDAPWRQRVLAVVDLPAAGWAVFTLGYVEGAKVAEQAATSDRWTVVPKGDSIEVRRVEGQALAGPIRVETEEDPFGSWGDMPHDVRAEVPSVRETWKLVGTHATEDGPIRTAMWTKWQAGNSRLELTFLHTAGFDRVQVAGRLRLDERSARVCLVLPLGTSRAEFDVLGGSIERGEVGEVPGGRWVRAVGGCGLGVVTDCHSAYELRDGELRITLARASRYAADEVFGAGEKTWRPSAGGGDMRFSLVLCPSERAPVEAEEMDSRPISVLAPAKPGALGRAGSLMHLNQGRMLAFKPAEDGNGSILRLVNDENEPIHPRLSFHGAQLVLPTVGPLAIATVRIVPEAVGYSVLSCTSDERPA